MKPLAFGKTVFVRSAADASGFPNDGRPRVVMVGRSNVGKSSTINALFGARLARVSGTPGKTVFVNLFLTDERLWVVDLPGYGYSKNSHAERERFSRLIDDYLARDREEIALMVLIVDARHKPTADDCMMAEWMRASGVPMLVLANKIDKLKPSQQAECLAVIRETLSLAEDVKLVSFSAEKQINKEEALSGIRQAVEDYGAV